MGRKELHMSISIFTLPNYKDMVHVNNELYLDSKAPSSTDDELMEFFPIWEKLTTGRFPGENMNFQRKISNKEYSMYPIVFISSAVWPDGHAYTTVHIVQKQDQNLQNCKNYENRFIDRENGVIILEKTKFYNGAEEPQFKYWFYEKDDREKLPDEVLLSEFDTDEGVYYLNILPENGRSAKGYLSGEAIRSLVNKCTFADRLAIGCALIQWPQNWNFVVHDYYGQKFFKVTNEEAEEFIARNNLFVA